MKKQIFMVGSIALMSAACARDRAVMLAGAAAVSRRQK